MRWKSILQLFLIMVVTYGGVFLFPNLEVIFAGAPASWEVESLEVHLYTGNSTRYFELKYNLKILRRNCGIIEGRFSSPLWFGHFQVVKIEGRFQAGSKSWPLHIRMGKNATFRFFRGLRHVRGWEKLPAALVFRCYYTLVGGILRPIAKERQERYTSILPWLQIRLISPLSFAPAQQKREILCPLKATHFVSFSSGGSYYSVVTFPQVPLNSGKALVVGKGKGAVAFYLQKEISRKPKGQTGTKKKVALENNKPETTECVHHHPQRRRRHLGLLVIAALLGLPLLLLRRHCKHR